MPIAHNGPTKTDGTTPAGQDPTQRASAPDATRHITSQVCRLTRPSLPSKVHFPLTVSGLPSSSLLADRLLNRDSIPVPDTRKTLSAHRPPDAPTAQKKETPKQQHPHDDCLFHRTGRPINHTGLPLPPPVVPDGTTACPFCLPLGCSRPAPSVSLPLSLWLHFVFTPSIRMEDIECPQCRRIAKGAPSATGVSRDLPVLRPPPQVVPTKGKIGFPKPNGPALLKSSLCCGVWQPTRVGGDPPVPPPLLRAG